MDKGIYPGRDTAVSLVQWLAPWREAWRALPDNPLAANLRQARQRALRAIPWWKRHIFTILILLVSLAIALMVAGVAIAEAVLAARPLQSTITSIEGTLAWAASITIFPVYFAWLLEGIYAAAVDSLTVLGRQSRQAFGLVLDDMLAITTISDHEIVLGALASLFPPLFLRIAVGAVLAPLTVVVSLGIEHMQRSYPYLLDQQMLGTLVAAPLSAALILLMGGAAALCCILYMLGLGRGLHIGNITSSAGVIASLSHLALIPVSLVLAFMLSSDLGYGDVKGENYFLLGGLMIFTAPTLLWLGLRLAQARQWFRYVLAVGTPLLVIFLMAVTGVLGFHYARQLFSEQLTGVYFASAFVSWLSMATLNLLPLAPSVIAAEGSNMQGNLGNWWLITLAIASQFAAQACLVVILSTFAAEAVRRRRRQDL